jgi:hypothetical protein
VAFYKTATEIDDAVGLNFETSTNVKTQEARSLHL